ncbi:hypothetical protein RclHR1_00340031 [Rhizophagus clarus]|uniref:P-loop containing nucleoside triphosphate hydrolase protein n=1 Tax=Rhizophagus clarus TaxID=94130 RepID=A0A2Z6RAG0_9GLOM|nr:hypothetical protein RclHR1_00340031 [Rhizophagus clarus]GES92845.1 P-loop containing nucleoside triphosphate hydrolase protein [Rhizophagus clarus]
MSATRFLRRLPTLVQLYRHQEITKFKEAFSYKIPRIHAILGPPNTGKTTLIHNVVNNGDFYPLIIDCHNGSFDTPANLYCSLITQFRQFFKKNPKLNKDHNLLNSNNFEITAKDVIELLQKINKTLLEYSSWDTFESPPILIFNEAHLFKKLAQSKEGETLLTSFLNWLITKILHTPSYVTPYIVGDLSKSEAELYFENEVLRKHETEVRCELEGQFDHVYRITGTRMLTIDHYVDEYKVHKGKFENFSEYKQEFDWLMNGLYPEELRLLGKPDPLWNKNKFIDAMRAVGRSPGYILENDLIKSIGYEAVSSLIEYNFLFRRSTNNFAYDIINPPEDKVILTAMSKPSEYAMRFFRNL